MPRIDVWDAAPPPVVQPSFNLGYPGGLEDKYQFGKQLGQGGFGLVRVVEDKTTGTQLACKTINKRLDIPNVSAAAQQRHLDNIKREVAILRRLRGTLNVAYLEDVYEDAQSVHMVMEWCKGGELLHSLGKRPYSEGTVADYMRAVMRTLAQCHHFKILHRDIKPGNFMLLNESPDAPLKAIDFGLAVFFDPKKLPITDLGFEGTPWFMAPEVLSSRVGPEADTWAAGIMAYQLLSGAFPFNDWANTRNPALSLVWRSILTEEPRMTAPCWADISDNAKDFIKQILNKDPTKRPSAKQALKHPWLAEGASSQRGAGMPLSATVVQKLQKFGLGNALKRTVLDMITNELLHKHANASRAAAAAAQEPGGAGGSGSQAAQDAEQGPEESAESRLPPASAKRYRKELAMGLLRAASLVAPKALTVHAGSDAKQLLAAATAAAGSRPGPWERGSRLPSGNFVPPPPRGRHGSQAWWSTQGRQVNPEAQNPAALPPHPPLQQGQLSAAFAAESAAAAAAAAAGQQTPERADADPAMHSLHYAFLTGVRGQTLSGVVRDDNIRRLMSSDRLESTPPAALPAQQPFSFTSPAKRISSSTDMLRLLGSVQRQRHEHRKMQRLGLDTSGRGLQGYREMVQPDGEGVEEGVEDEEAAEDAGPATSCTAAITIKEPNGSPPKQEGATDTNQEFRRTSSLAKTQADMLQDPALCTQDEAEEGGHGKRAFVAFLAASRTSDPDLKRPSAAGGEEPADDPMEEGRGSRRGRSGYANLLAQGSGELNACSPSPVSSGLLASTGLMPIYVVPKVHQQRSLASHALGTSLGTSFGTSPGPIAALREAEAAEAAAAEQRRCGSVGAGGSGGLLSALEELMPSQEQLKELKDVLARMNCGPGGEEELSFGQISEGLKQLGYRLEPSEVEQLLREMAGQKNTLSQSQFIASQLDWRAFQANHRDEWLDCLRKTFESIDVGGTGSIRVEQIMELLGDKLPEGEVNMAVQEMLMDTAIAPEGIDFDNFTRLVREDSFDTFSSSSASVHGLDLYDARFVMDAMHEHFNMGLDTVMDGDDDGVDGEA